ncbi:hypothetical protein QYM36_000241, partial [Artemia franciscana]
RPNLWCGNPKFHDFLNQFVPVFSEKFWPTIWCFEARAQTVFASLLRSRIAPISYSREIFQLSDGGEVCLDWTEPTRFADSAPRPVVIFLPGLTGHSQSDYIKSLVKAALKVNATAVVFNNRGRGGIGIKTPKTYCGACSLDFSEIVCYVRRKYPTSIVVAAGISLGGLILGNYLATNGSKARIYLDAAMIVSVPWDVLKGTVSLEKPILNLMLNRHLAGCLAQSLDLVKHQFETVDGKWNIELALAARTIREFDTHFTSKQFGFSDLEEYYKAACLHDKIHRIKVPTLCLSARDDPFQPDEAKENTPKSSQSDLVRFCYETKSDSVSELQQWMEFLPMARVRGGKEKY